MKHIKKNILITGANGQLGTSLALLANSNDANFYCTDIDTLDITNKTAIAKYITENKIDIVVNCAAYTNVDKAEDEEKLAMRINGVAPANLAYACKKNGAFLIHISTDYVFGGGKTNIPYNESVKPHPLGVYGVTKLKGEESIKEILANSRDNSCGYIIIRTSWLYSEYGNNFVKTILKLLDTKENLNVVFDQVGTPTYATDLANVIYKILIQILEDKFDRKNCGIYNYSNEGVCSWYDFALEIKKISKKKSAINPCHSDEFPSKVKRPNYSVLDKTKIKRVFGVVIPHWSDSLKKCCSKLV